MKRSFLRISSALWLGILAVGPATTMAPGRLEAQEQAESSLNLEDCLVWGALIRGSHAPIDGESPLAEDLGERLKQAFGYEHFLLMGEHTQPVLAEFASYVVPSEELYMKIDCEGPVEDGLGLQLQLWREESVIVKTDVILRDHSPVLIAGPKWGDDQLFFVVELQVKDNQPVASTTGQP
jgi:hypothetical protein